MAAILAGLVALLLGLGGVYYIVGEFRGWFVRKQSVDELIALLEPAVRLYKPDGPGPFPAVIQLHGCGGCKPIQDEYAAAARAVGALVVVLDSLKPRGIGFDRAQKLVCSGRVLRGRERAGDLVAGLEMVRRRPDVDASRIALVGWSHGAWTIMDLMALDLSKEAPFNLKEVPKNVWKGVKAIELIYPYCGFPALTRERGWKTIDIPVDALLLEGDTVASLGDTHAAFDRARRSGGQIDVETWTGVTHAFEETEHVPGSGLRHDPVRAVEAHKRYAAWVRRTLGL